MGQRIIDAWVKTLVGRPFIWGKTDCHQLLYDFVKITNPQWSDPYDIGKLKGSYSTPIQAIKVAKTLKIAEWFEELGYTARQVNRVETGDIVWVEETPINGKKRKYDLYMPVVFNQTVICGDPNDDTIKLRHIMDVSHYNYKVYRKNGNV